MKMLLPPTHCVDAWLDQIDAQTMVRQTHAARYKNLFYTLKAPKELVSVLPVVWPDKVHNTVAVQSPYYFSSNSFAASRADALRIKPDVLDTCNIDDHTQSILQSLIESVVQDHVILYVHDSEHHTISLQSVLTPNALCQKVTIVVAPNTQVTIVDDRIYDQSHAIECVELYAQEHARITWLHQADQKKINNLLLRTYCMLHENAHIAYVHAAKPAYYSYHEWYVDLKGANSTVEYAGVYVLSENQNYTLRTYQQHNARNTHSLVSVKGLLNDSSYFDYAGLINIAKPAAGTQAHQENKNMLFSSHALARSEPSLQVLTNDVQCSHGSATGYFDPEQILYAQSRGISKAQIYTMLTHAFCSDVIALLDATYKESFVAFVQEFLEK